MIRKRKFVSAAAIFGVALSMGFIVQNGDALASRLGPVELTDASQITAAPIAASAATGALPKVTDQAQEIAPLVEMIALAEEQVILEPTVDTCAITVEGQALPLAMVALSIDAPCQPAEYVTFHHMGMMFKEQTDTEGRIDVIAPAFAETAVYLVSFGSGVGTTATVLASDYMNFDRAVLQWQGINAVQLHALEFGADYGSDGHVWSAAARDLDFMTPPSGGFLITLGDPTVDQPLMAEVYTYPSGTAQATGTVGLSVEAEVTAANCGREVFAQSLQFGPAHAPEAFDLIMTMPSCDAIGEFLVLKNMFKDLKLAAK